MYKKLKFLWSTTSFFYNFFPPFSTLSSSSSWWSLFSAFIGLAEVELGQELSQVGRMEKKRKIISVLRTNELDRKQQKKTYQVKLKASIFPPQQSFLLQRAQRVRLTEEELARISWRKRKLSNSKKSSRMRISKCEEEKFPIEIDIDSHGIGLRTECKVHNESIRGIPAESDGNCSEARNFQRVFWKHNTKKLDDTEERMKTSNRWYIQMKYSPAIRYHHEHRNWAQWGSRERFKVQLGNIFLFEF